MDLWNQIGFKYVNNFKEMEEKNEELKETGLLDYISSRLVSRKLLIAIVATILVITGKITGDNWEKVIMVYLVSQGAVDLLVSSYFGAGNQQSNSSPSIKIEENLEGKGPDDVGGEYQKPEGEITEEKGEKPIDLG